MRKEERGEGREEDKEGRRSVRKRRRVGKEDGKG